MIVPILSLLIKIVNRGLGPDASKHKKAACIASCFFVFMDTLRKKWVADFARLFLKQPAGKPALLSTRFYNNFNGGAFFLVNHNIGKGRNAD